MTRFALTLALALVLPAGALVAQDSPIEQRQELMKNNGDQLGVAGNMLKGEADWDGAAAAAAMAKIAANAEELPPRFPEGTDTGFDTRALPIIWEDKDDFNQRLMELHERGLAAEEAAAGGMDQLRPVFSQVLDTCNGCHEKYRRPR
jgi:cytochrome c556